MFKLLMSKARDFGSTRAGQVFFSILFCFLAFAALLVQSQDLQKTAVLQILVLLFLAASFGFFLKKRRQGLDVLVLVASFAFACFVVVGVYYTSGFKGDWALLCLGIAFIGNSALFFVLISDLLILIRAYVARDVLRTQPFDRKYWMIAFLALLLFWLPYFIGFFPANIPYDAAQQIYMSLGAKPLSSHHPLLSTYLIQLFLVFGEFSGIGYKGGIFLFICFQGLMSAAIFGYIAAFIRRISLAGYVLCLLFFGVLPTWGDWVTVLGKDMLYYAWFALFCVKVCQWSLSRRVEGFSWSKIDYAALLITSLIMIAFRKDGLFVVIPVLAIMAIKDRNVPMCSMLGIAFASVIAVSVFSSIVSEKDAQPYDAFAVPLQQISRVVTYHEDDLTEKDKGTIDKVLNIDDVAERYNPINADPIKDKANRSAAQKDLARFAKLYLSLGIRYPQIYLSAFLNHSFGYYYPFYIQDTLGDTKLYIQDAEELSLLCNEEIGYSGEPIMRDIRKTLIEYWKLFRQLPVLGLLTTCGTYTWALLLLIVILLSFKRKFALVAFVAPVICVLIATVSPVNAYLRYSLPLMAAIPVLIAYVDIVIRGKEESLKSSG